MTIRTGGPGKPSLTSRGYPAPERHRCDTRLAVHPRLFGIQATKASVVAVLRRGPSDWSQVSRWDPEAGTFERGSWIHANIYPQRCDLSPDGRWLTYFTLKAGARWSIGSTYIAVSRLPWLTALAAWGTCGTWTHGLHFEDNRRVWEVDAPGEGDIEPLRRRSRLGLGFTRAIAFAVERRRGWTEAEGSAPYDRELDPWDTRRAEDLVMERRRPGAEATRLTVTGSFAAFRAGPPSWSQATYGIEANGGRSVLEAVQWADWDRAGRLLVATTNGRLQVRDAPFRPGNVTWELDVTGDRPVFFEPPAEARRWVP